MNSLRKAAWSFDCEAVLEDALAASGRASAIATSMGVPTRNHVDWRAHIKSVFMADPFQWPGDVFGRL